MIEDDLNKYRIDHGLPLLKVMESMGSDGRLRTMYYDLEPPDYSEDGLMVIVAGSPDL